MPPIFENLVLSDDDCVPPPKKTKKEKKPDGRKTREMSEERRAQLLENLKKGRATSAAKRGKKASVKNILKEKSDQFQNRIIDRELGAVDELQTLREELKMLREKLNNNNNIIEEEEPQAPIVKERFIKTQPHPQPPPFIADNVADNDNYASQFANGGRPYFSPNDIIKDQLDYKKNKKYTGSINSRFLNF